MRQCYLNQETDGIRQNIYEKWLRRRLNYATIRETGNHAAPDFIHTIIHSGNCRSHVASEIRDKMWNRNKYPNSDFFHHGMVAYRYPPVISEIMDLRFNETTPSKCSYGPYNQDIFNTYDLSIDEMTRVTKWMGNHTMINCPYPHSHEEPLTWRLREERHEKSPAVCHYPARVHEPVYPSCCQFKDYVCSSVYCKYPLPEAVYNPGPLGHGDALVRWHFDPMKGK
ncbi:uncharacterized protein LOC131948184 [Physella acuta]|uniref:uncharacterized protein LOC131948184 n=1 Tax=Physella acuta TaxID=109671 RepID=UPI0027DE86AB|nr:uncharacterized protein LOC131948184 [Physella acuta]